MSVTAGPAAVARNLRAYPITVETGIFDMVYDAQRGILYMTTGGANILRYQMSTQTFLKPLIVLGNLQGIDISADGGQLAVADMNSGDGKIWVDLYDLSAGSVRKLYGESADLAGTLDVAYGPGKSIAVSGALPSGYSGSAAMYAVDEGQTALRPVEGSGALFASDSTVVRASPDHVAVAWTAGDDSGGPWGTTVPQKKRDYILDMVGWQTYDVAVAALGRYYAIPTYNATYVFDRHGLGLETLGKNQGAPFIGAVFDPLKPRFLYQTSTAGFLDVFDVETETLAASYSLGSFFVGGGNHIFNAGYLRFASDGTFLFMKTTTGAVGIKVR